MEASEREVLRYLGYRGAAADELVLEHIRKVSAELEKYSSPGSVYGIWDIQVAAPIITLDGMTVSSKHLAGHLEGCGQAVLMAATLGTGADDLIRRYSVGDMELAVIAQAVCAARIEAYCDQLENEIARKAEGEGLYLTARFSPGYGDFHIEHQKDILQLLDCGRRIGLTMSDEYMLIPSKSVTAVIGLSRKESCAKDKCEDCMDGHCEFRKGNG